MALIDKGFFRFGFIVAAIAGLAVLAVSTTRAQQQGKAQQACIVSVNKAVRGVAKAEAKLIGGCMKTASKTGASFQACHDADAKQRVFKARAKTAAAVASKCTQLPDFGFTGADAANDGAILQVVELLH